MISYDVIRYRYHMTSYHMIISYDMILENFRRTDREQTDRQFKT